jgi:hypothetical protein
LCFDAPDCVAERLTKERGVTLGDQSAMPRRVQDDLHPPRSAVSLKPHHGVDGPLESRGKAFDGVLCSGPDSIGNDSVVSMKDDVHELTLRVWLG